MAFLSINEFSSDKPSVFASISGAFGRFFTAVMDAQDRSAEVQKLQSLSDEELADLGIQREDIIRHVFRGVFYM